MGFEILIPPVLGLGGMGKKRFAIAQKSSNNHLKMPDFSHKSGIVETNHQETTIEVEL
ncbi:MAG: hypothetical protein ACLBM1_05170 [Cuspidothrix sp.]